MTRRILALPLALLIAGALPDAAEAQGNSRGQAQRELRGAEREQPRLERRDRDDRRYDDDRAQPERRAVPPGWCIGRGNPHNTVANCGYRNARGGTARHDTRYERRGGGYGNYDDAHRAFHREHDAWCRARANERRTDLRWQVTVRRQCQEAHDRFHQEWGTPHR